MLTARIRSGLAARSQKRNQLDFLFWALFYFGAVSYFWAFFFLESFQIEHPTASGSHALLCWRTGLTARVRSGLTARSLEKQLDFLFWAVFYFRAVSYFWALFFLELLQIEQPTAGGSHALSCWWTGLTARMRSGLTTRSLEKQTDFLPQAVFYFWAGS